VERQLVNLCCGLVELGQPLDLVLVKDRSPALADLPEAVRIVRLGTRHTLTSVLALARYLRREKPRVLLAAKDRAARTAVLSRRLSGHNIPLVVRLGTTLSAALSGKPAWRRRLWYFLMRRFYPHMDAIVGVSKGVAEDVRQITNLPSERFHVIPNPVITRTVLEKAEQPITHRWMRQDVPLVLGIGRLTRQKDFPTLLRAFAEVRKRRELRLVILGEGGDRASLIGLARELGIEEDLDLPGFSSNPYAWLRKVRLFVLSSAWEGSPNALTEALAMGTQVVATDCPSGPREILDGGRIAPLVPVGDAAALAAAMEQVLAAPVDPETLRAAAKAYTVENSSRRYLALLEEKIQQRKSR